jgi:predicted ribosomally synthesized peptide with SipW-like signal peptide
MKSKKLIILSTALALIAGGIAIGGTYALFTANAENQVEVQAGKIKLTAVLSGLKTYSMGTETAVSGTFDNGGQATIEGSTVKLDKVTPGDKVEVNVGLTNDSNVITKYVLFVDAAGDLAGKLTISGITEVTSWQELQVGVAPAAGVLSIELPKEVGNEYQEKSAAVTIFAYAIQANGDLSASKQAKVGSEEYANVIYDELGNVYHGTKLGAAAATPAEVSTALSKAAEGSAVYIEPGTAAFDLSSVAPIAKKNVTVSLAAAGTYNGTLVSNVEGTVIEGNGATITSNTPVMAVGGKDVTVKDVVLVPNAAAADNFDYYTSSMALNPANPADSNNDGTKKNFYKNGITLGDGVALHLENVTIEAGFQSSIYSFGDSIADAGNDVELLNCTINGGIAKGVYLGNVANLHVKGCTFIGGNVDPSSADYPEWQTRSLALIDINQQSAVGQTVKIEDSAFKNLTNTGSTAGAIKIKTRGDLRSYEVKFDSVSIINNTFTNNVRDFVAGTGHAATGKTISFGVTDYTGNTSDKTGGFVVTDNDAA